MKTLFIIILFSMIFFIVGVATQTVGTVLPCLGEPVSVTLPVKVCIIMAIPAALGYLIGIED